jgi:hypothetical protein
MSNIVQFSRPEDKEVTEFVKNSNFMILKFDEKEEQVHVMTNTNVNFKTLVLAHVAYLSINDYMRMHDE